MSKPLIIPVIMSGGSGTRLWPLSNEKQPKQMHALFTERTLLQETIARVPVDCGFNAPIIICSSQHCDEVKQQLSAIGVQPLVIIGEPTARNTAPCAYIAARAVSEHFGEDALILLLAADHFIADPVSFRQSVHQGAVAATDGNILTFGPKPTRPETGYGYVLAGAEIKHGVHKLQKFVEKPDIKTAKSYFKDGRYLWNSGMFLFPAKLMQNEIRKHRPKIALAANQAYEHSLVSDAKMLLDPKFFATCPSESIDTAVMENTDIGAIIPLDAGWSDIGSWETIYELSQKDTIGNAITGPIIPIETENCLIRSDGIRIGTVGIKDLAIIANGKEILITALAQSQKVRDVVATMGENKE